MNAPLDKMRDAVGGKRFVNLSDPKKQRRLGRTLFG